MKQSAKYFAYLILYLTLIFMVYEFMIYGCQQVTFGEEDFQIHLESLAYNDSGIHGVWNKLVHRVHTQPFNLVSLVIFSLAVIHTLCASVFSKASASLRRKLGEDNFTVEVLRFLGEVEVVFGLWVIPLMLSMALFYNWQSAIYYVNSRGFVEPIFVVVIMTISSTYPILNLVERGLSYIVKLGGETVQSWWWVLLTVGPLLGSFITEPGAMTVCALLLSKKFYNYKPSSLFAYGTLGLLFVNISVGGVLTCFAAPPVVLVSRVWGFDTLYMMQSFGWKAVVGILASNLCYFYYFRNEFAVMEKYRNSKEKTKTEEAEQVPHWISIIHAIFLSWIVLHSIYPVIVVGSFLLFIGFYQATKPFQHPLSLKTPVLVGFFLSALIVHGGLQGWWITPILGSVTEGVMMVSSIVLTAFNDNAEITFLSTLIPDLDESMKYAVIAGAVTGGGLTVIANAPNPAGQALLHKHFGAGISAKNLFYAALTPTVIVGLTFYCFRYY